MLKFLVHFPVFLSLAATVLFVVCALSLTYWFFIPAWQTACISVMLVLDGRNRMQRFRKMKRLLEQGMSVDRLPRENTICGFFIRTAVLIANKPVKTG